jgi:hypothetical protein
MASGGADTTPAGGSGTVSARVAFAAGWIIAKLARSGGDK